MLATVAAEREEEGGMRVPVPPSLSLSPRVVPFMTSDSWRVAKVRRGDMALHDLAGVRCCC